MRAFGAMGSRVLREAARGARCGWLKGAVGRVRVRVMGLKVAWMLFAVVAGWQGEVWGAAGEVKAAFEAANRLYEEQRYGEAAAAYERLVAGGKVSSSILFNWGNAFYKSGQVGRAIVRYRRAAELAPRDPDIAANLQFARGTVAGGGTGVRERWRRWLGRLSLNEWTGLTVGLWWGGMLLLAAGVWRPEWKRSLRPFVLCAGFAGFLAAGGLARVAWEHLGTESVVVVVPEAEVRNGPLEVSPAFYRVRDGQELRVVDRKEDWVRVEDNARRAGWVRQEALEWVEEGWGRGPGRGGD